MPAGMFDGMPEAGGGGEGGSGLPDLPSSDGQRMGQGDRLRDAFAQLLLQAQQQGAAPGGMPQLGPGLEPMPPMPPHLIPQMQPQAQPRMQPAGLSRQVRAVLMPDLRDMLAQLLPQGGGYDPFDAEERS